MKVGWVGVGDQGEPMAQRALDGGFALALYARRPEQAARLVAGGAVLVPTIAELAARSDLFAICVANDPQVEEVVEAALPHLGEGAILVIHSTVDPDLCRRIGRQAGERGVRVIDAPVSGGRQRAFEGRLTLMVGGEPEDLELARPVFETQAALIAHVGPLGSGQVLKLANNYLLAAQLAVTRDAITLLEELDLDVCEGMRAIAASTGSSRIIESFVLNGCENVFGRHMKGRTHGAGLLAKDIALVDAVGQRAGATFPPALDSLVRTGLQIAWDAGAADDAEAARAQTGQH